MKSLLIALSAGAALAAGLATTAAAAPGHDSGYGHPAPAYGPQRPGPAAPAWVSVGQRQANLQQRIEFGLRTGALTRSEAYRLRAELQSIERLERRYRAGGLNRWEMADLDQRMDGLSRRIFVQNRDDDRRYGQGYGYGHRR